MSRPAGLSSRIVVLARVLGTAGILLGISACGSSAPDAKPTDLPQASESPPATVTLGLDVFVRSGCGACHTYTPAGSESTQGPDLDRVAQRADSAVLRESIVAPDAQVAPGFETGLMPTDYEQRLTPDELEALIEFLLTGEPAGG